jgi:hypothetical protein
MIPSKSMAERVNERVTLMFGLIPVALLLAVATAQLYLAKTADLSPWRVGGFGMFSSVGDINTRYLRAHGVKDNQETALDLTTLEYHTAYQFRVLPSDSNFQALVQGLSCNPEVQPLYKGIRLEYFTATFEASPPQLRVSKVREQSHSCGRP